jgi:hypothetical protein
MTLNSPNDQLTPFAADGHDIEDLAYEYLTKVRLLQNNGQESNIIGKSAAYLYKEYLDRANSLGLSEDEWLDTLDRLST